MSAPNEPESTPFDDADTGEIDDLGMGTEEHPSDGDETSDQIDTGGQDWSVSDASSDEEEWSGEESYEEEYEHYVPPDTLPPPYPSGSTLPLFAVLLSLIVTLLLGGALAAASKYLYIPLVYNVVAGVAIGWAVGKAPQWSNFTSGFFLFWLVVVCSFLTYAVAHVGCYLLREYETLEDFQYFFQQPWLQQWTEIREHLHARGLNLKAFGYHLGLKWAIAAWSAEVLLTLMVAWLFVRPSIRLSVAEGVPPDVLEMVLNLQQEGFTAGGIRDELKLRGWARRSDQSKALRASAAYDRLVGNR